MKRSLSVLLILALLLSCTVFSGCGEEEQQNYPVTVGGVTVAAEPKNVVVLDDSFADILSYMGYDRKLVARSFECDQDYLSIFPSVGPAGKPNISTVVSQGADLVIADSSLSDSVRKELQSKGITVVTLNRAQSFADLQTLYTDLGTLLGGNTVGSKKGADAYADLINRLGQYKSSYQNVAKTSVYLYLDNSGELCTFTEGSFEQQLFGYNGSINALSHQKKAQVVTYELRMGSPGVIFYDSDAVLEYLRRNDTLANLSALQKERYCKIPLKDFYRCGTTCEQIMYDMASFLDSADQPATDDEPDDDEGYDDNWDDDSWDDDSWDDGYDDYD